MKLICGLGNYGRCFRNNRHNLGFIAVDFIRKALNFPPFHECKTPPCLFTEGRIEAKRVYLLKLKTFMNFSGEYLKIFLHKKRIKTKDLWVIHDDLDIPFGQIKISYQRGSGGHNGVQSIIESLGTKDFVRLRIGIRPSHMVKKSDFVLEDFSGKEKRILRPTLKQLVLIVKTAILKNLEIPIPVFLTINNYGKGKR